MSKKEKVLTPVGRFVKGSLYEGKTTDMDGNPLLDKNGQPRKNYFFAIAIRKLGETHWNQTPWGTVIYNAGVAGFPQGQHASKTFAWKIEDGDDTSPNRNNVRPCDCEGFPGHWVLKFSGGIIPKVCTADGSAYITELDAVKLGDYIQVAGNVCGNDSTQQPGIYLNPEIVAHAGYGERIVIGIDPKTAGFGQSPLPAGCSPVPLAGMSTPAPVAAYTPPPVPVAAPVPAPYPQVLTPPVPAPMAPPVPPAAPMRIMTAKAGATPYEAYIANGWTDDQLIQHGFMVL